LYIYITVHLAKKHKIYTLFAASPSRWQAFKANAPQLNTTALDTRRCHAANHSLRTRSGLLYFCNKCIYSKTDEVQTTRTS